MEDGRFILSGAVGHAQSVDTVSVDGPEGFIELGGLGETQVGAADHRINAVPAKRLQHMVENVDHASMGAAQHQDQALGRIDHQGKVIGNRVGADRAAVVRMQRHVGVRPFKPVGSWNLAGQMDSRTDFNRLSIQLEPRTQ
jgi:hypothetical protein